MKDPSGKILNPALYRRLKQVFGEVKVSRCGEPLVLRQGDVTPLQMGEYYRVNCPFCGEAGRPDRHFHLWINHRWGIGFGVDRMFWAAICYRQDCLRRADNLERLKDMIRPWTLPNFLPEPEALEDSSALETVAVDLPGTCLPLEDYISDWIVEYLAERGFEGREVLELAERYDLQCCVACDNPALVQSLVIPFYEAGLRFGWQCRGPRLKGYYSCPSMKISHHVYALDDAVSFDYVVIVEGAADVWKVGPPAVAVCGGQVSAGQARRLADYFGLAILMLDGDALPERRARSIQQLEQAGICVEEAVLPPDEDPASLTREECWNLIYGALSRLEEKAADRQEALWFPG